MQKGQSTLPKLILTVVVTLTTYLLTGCGSAVTSSNEILQGPSTTLPVSTRGLPSEPPPTPVTNGGALTATEAPTTEVPPLEFKLPPMTAEEGAGWTSSNDQMDLVYIPDGKFRMGTLPEYIGAQPDERPQRIVRLAAYWVDSTEVTWEQYQRCEQAGACQLISPLRPDWAEDDHPVVLVTWQDANNYCRWVGRRLPTEAEWEKAARGTEGRRYPWEWIGAPESRGELRLNFCDASCPFDFRSTDVDDGYAYTAPVGSFPAGASPYGALDMAGNVWEWTADWYQANRYADDEVDLSLGPTAGSVRVIRGGSWLESAWRGLVMTSRSANRAWSDPELARPDLGFRCVISAQASETDG